MFEEIPDFIIIGAMKAGTTSLYRYLQSHPGVFMSEVKEPSYFVLERNWSKGPDWYRSLFAGAPAGALLGEASTNYSKGTLFPGVPQLLRKNVPDVKLIYLIRDPLERIRSHYAYAVRHRTERRSAEQAITRESIFVRTSQYGAELQRYLEHFPNHQMLILLTEDLRDEPAAVLRRVEQFLGLDEFAFPHLERHYNVTRNGRMTTLLSSAVEQRERLLDVTERLVPERIRERRLTGAVGRSRPQVPPKALTRIRDVLAADRELLLSQVDLDLSKWMQLDELSPA